MITNVLLLRNYIMIMFIIIDEVRKHRASDPIIIDYIDSEFLSTHKHTKTHTITYNE